MDRYKFRAWDNVHGKIKEAMVYSDSFKDIYSSIELAGFWQWISQHTSMPIMQYTGLKDKNGKEIYEGDILKYTLGEIEEEICLCGWDNFNLCFALNPEAKNESWHHMFNCFDEVYEIIGNIYENPEFLREEK